MLKFILYKTIPRTFRSLLYTLILVFFRQASNCFQKIYLQTTVIQTTYRNILTFQYCGYGKLPTLQKVKWK